MGQAKRRGTFEQRVLEAKSRKGISVGFYDEQAHRMVEVERWDGSWTDARITSVKLTAIYQSGKHRLPSPVWCVWDEEDSSLFMLDEKFRDEDYCNKVEELMV